MVEDTLRKAKEYPSKMTLWKAIPKQMQYQTFSLILDYLSKSNKIIFTKDKKVMWIASNSKLEKAIRKGTEL
jgi:hypothetical protein